MPDSVAHELAIRALIARYSDDVNQRDDALWASTWTEDGEWTLFGRSKQGREELRKWFVELVGGLDWVIQLMNSGSIELQGSRASGRWYLTEMNLQKGAPGLLVGVYHDQYAQVDGQWLFSSRRFDPLYVGPPDLSGSAMPFPSVSSTS